MTSITPQQRLDPLQHETAPLRSKIVKSLRAAIESGVLKPGTRLVEKHLQEQLNVSRTSLREALRELRAEGILADMSNRGLAVRDISSEDASNIYRVRSVIVALVIEQFIEKATDRDVAALRVQAENLKAQYRSGDAEAIVVAKRAFYGFIYETAGNTIALDVLDKLSPLTSPLRRFSIVRPERRQQSIAEIDAIVDAIVRRDVEAGRLAAEAHVAASEKSALQGH